MASLNLSENSPLLKNARLSLYSAQIKFQNDSATYFRWKNLWEQNIGTRNNLDEAYRRYMLSKNEKQIAEEALRSRTNELRVTYNTADAQLAQARKEVADVCVKSDQPGVVYQVLKERGETVNINEPLVLLGDAHRRYVKLYVDQQDISRIRIGQKVLLQIDANSGEIHEAAVSFISPLMNEADQTFMIEAEFVKAGRHNFVHSSVEANIIVDEKKNALVVPRATLDGRDSIWTNRNGKGRKVAVKTGIENLDFVEIVSGIEAGTPLIINQETPR
jgi:multidrug efflux pump subunit AcrA (membrane-fusion protein)